MNQTKSSTTDDLCNAKQMGMLANCAHDLKTVCIFYFVYTMFIQILTFLQQSLFSQPLAAMHSGDELAFNILISIRMNLEKLFPKLPAGLLNDYDLALEAIGTSLGMCEFMQLSINRCMELAKMRTHNMKLVPYCETISLVESLELPRRVMTSVFPEQKVAFNCIPKEICSHIITDRQWLQENLLCFGSNAAKYSPLGSRIEFTLSLCRESKLGGTVQEQVASSSEYVLTTSSTDIEDPLLLLLVLECEDNGIGMSEEAMASLFAPFQQAQRLAGGTGLGLFSLSQRMEALNGHCGVRGRRDGTQGSLFWFAVPYRPDINAALYDEDKDEPIIAMKPALVHPSAASLKINTSCNDVLHLDATTPVTVSWNNVTTSTSSIASLSQALSPMVRKRDGGLSPGSLRLKLQLAEQQKLRLGGVEQFPSTAGPITYYSPPAAAAAAGIAYSS
jgi:signal transduction histidine kinase